VSMRRPASSTAMPELALVAAAACRLASVAS
jgi:hypothetical protein